MQGHRENKKPPGLEKRELEPERGTSPQDQSRNLSPQPACPPRPPPTPCSWLPRPPLVHRSRAPAAGSALETGGREPPPHHPGQRHLHHPPSVSQQPHEPDQKPAGTAQQQRQQPLYPLCKSPPRGRGARHGGAGVCKQGPGLARLVREGKGVGFCPTTPRPPTSVLPVPPARPGLFPRVPRSMEGGRDARRRGSRQGWHF